MHLLSRLLLSRANMPLCTDPNSHRSESSLTLNNAASSRAKEVLHRETIGIEKDSLKPEALHFSFFFFFSFSFWTTVESATLLKSPVNLLFTDSPYYMCDRVLLRWLRDQQNSLLSLQRLSCLGSRRRLAASYGYSTE